MNNLNKEDGYILIVVVGILMVFSLMAVTFARLSRVETKAARNYADSIKCDAVAKAGLEHAIYAIRLDKFGTDTIVYNDDSGGDTNYDYPGDASWPGYSIFVGSDYDNDGDSTEDSQWVYIPGTTTATSAIRLPGSLRARYAVLITDDREARININVTGNKADGGSHAANEGWSTFEIDLADLIQREVGNGTTIANLIIDERHGDDSEPGDDGENDNSLIIPDPQNDDIDNDGDWDIVEGDDTNDNGIPDPGEPDVNEGDEVTDEPGEFNPIFPDGDDVPFDILTEVEIMDTSAYTSELEVIFTGQLITPEDQDDLKDYLTTYSADTILCPEYLLDGVGTSTKLNINALVYNEGAYTNTGTYNTIKKVEMIIDVLEAGGILDVPGTDKYMECRQLAVNIKDFIDSDGTSTTYLDPSGDTYYGVDKGTPYINEVEAKVDNTSGGNGKYIELFNPFDENIDITGWKISGTTMPEIILGGTINAGEYYVIADDATAYATDFAYEGVGIDADEYNVLVNNLKDQGETLTLNNGSKDVQVTNCPGTTAGKTMQLNDPRPIPITTADPSDPWEWAVTPTETAGEENDPSTFNPMDGDDNWNKATPTWPDSFLIANRRFSNKGYLGYIHRGSEWSSFIVNKDITEEGGYQNVLQYITITDPSMDGIDNDGDGKTDSADTGAQTGDLDGKEYRIPGLINVNTASVEVLESLPNITNAIAIAIQGSGSKPFTSIGHLVDDVTEITGAGTKWEEEETFRSISNLITTRSNVFTVYVTAQITNEAETSVFAEKKIKAIVDRSVNPIQVRYFRWITE
jgi:hypothetical protein